MSEKRQKSDESPPAKRQKLDASHAQIDLANALSRFPSFFGSLDNLLDEGLPERFTVWLPFLQYLSAAAASTAPAPGPSYVPSRMSLPEVIERLGLDFDPESNDYMWTVNDDQRRGSAKKPLSTWAATAIAKIKSARRISHREPSVRTLFDILLTDRLNQLEDSNANCKLVVDCEVPLTATVKPEHDGGTISGKADLALGYMDKTDQTEQMFIVVEAKSAVHSDSNMAQLLAYLYAIQEARTKARKYSTAVFGVITDFKIFIFLVLRANRKVMRSEPLLWNFRNDDVITFMDSILLDAIKSSPHTTPQKISNTTIKRFDSHIQSEYGFQGERSDVGGGEIVEDGDEWDVVEVEGKSVLIPHRDHRGGAARSEHP